MNTIEQVSKIVGIPSEESKRIFQEVKDNSKLLESCPRHDFSIVLDRRTKTPIENPTPQQRFGAYFRCANCGGRVDGLARIWYDRGLKDATPNRTGFGSGVS